MSAPPAFSEDGAVDPLIAKARQETESFTATLPDYICQQFTSRFVSGARLKWLKLDVVSADVVYERGGESYRNVAINGKPAATGMDGLSGTWSTGEFASGLRALFAAATATEFRFRRNAKAAGMPAAIYDYRVRRENSHWKLQAAPQTLLAAYEGSIWIDLEAGRALRIESKARDLPPGFPISKAETVTDYGYVRIGGAQRYLLPAHSEAVLCERVSSLCSRNVIDFRNYKKYVAEASIVFDK